MPVAIKKYKFYTIKTEFCGFIIKLKKLSINLKKIKAIINKNLVILQNYNCFQDFIITIKGLLNSG